MHGREKTHFFKALKRVNNKNSPKITKKLSRKFVCLTKRGADFFAMSFAFDFGHITNK